ncbi:MAG: CBS domain-containing protein [Betaproteobacteria bacterium]|nr:CBS domain-containing protein [Betaproteobacteria bacterium]MDE2124389.1 CBS domain-containing protein [Betaproteobacteria bacterium]MDE2186777.1 CBS domain-containing protein [Betaproteobacteria bacterium]MDE2325382.1 CBS domain-containing protein [Betaproteobacteria bacterium]
MNYAPIKLSCAAATLCVPGRVESHLPAVHLHDPALTVMTDFACEYPVVTDPRAQIDAALQDMMRFGVRALVVVEQGAMHGLITAQDIMGERPLQFLQGPACTHDTCLHQDVLVSDIMTPVAELPMLDVQALLTARVGDLVETFKVRPETHLVVVEHGLGQPARLRGLVSRTRLERQLGTNIAPVSYLPPMQAALAVARS